MNAQVQWKSRLSFTGSADTGFEVPLGSYPEVGGDNDGFRPLELLAVGLAGCTAMDVISILMKKRQEIRDFQVQVKTERSDQHPRVFTSGRIEYHLAGSEVQEKAVARAIELSASTYCPAHAMLGKAVPLEMVYMIYEGEKIDSGELVLQGQVELAAEN